MYLGSKIEKKTGGGLFEIQNRKIIEHFEVTSVKSEKNEEIWLNPMTKKSFP